jgi:histidinol dehydrogenase
MLSIRNIRGAALTEATIGQYLPRGQENLEKIKEDVEKILQDVRANGDKAINAYTQKFDGIDMTNRGIEVSEEEINAAFNQVKPELVEALKKAKGNIEKFHRAQIREDWFIETMPGVRTGQIMRPIQRAGLYVPGGTAVYPSSVLMEAVPAKVAGVEQLILCSPPQKDGQVASAILVAARICGVNKIFRCGGAQAVAGMAYGTESIPKVQKIVGPGNKWVAAAKQLVSNECAIDNPAGPSEILLIADETTNPEWAAYDLLAQAEHGPDNVAVLLSGSEEINLRILTALEELVNSSGRSSILVDNLNKYGLSIVAKSEEQILELINLISTEHLHIQTKDPQKWLPLIKNAGAIFLGGYSPVPLGDYCAGTNHVLPTAGYAKVYSGLSSFDFMKFMDVLDCNATGLNELAEILKPIAEFEGLTGHRDAVLARKKPNKES